MTRAWIALIAAVTTSAACITEQAGDDTAECEGGKCDGAGSNFVDPYKHLDDIETREFEYIVVGSGAGGGPLAANLARQGHSVLLLEAGKETGGKTESVVPVLHPTATETPDLAWWYFVDHYSNKARQAKDSKDTPEGVLYPRGGTLGGSTAVNAMITVLPPNRDWDDIATLTGDASWSAAKMQPYFHRVTKWLSVERQDVNADALFDKSLVSILTGAFKEAADAGLGGPDVSLTDPLRNLFTMFGFLKRDINTETLGGRGSGVFQFPLATKNHKRNGTREYINATVQDARRFPLRVKTQALVTKVIFASRSDSVDFTSTAKEVWPGPATQTRAQIGDWVKKEAWGHHASCSAPIGAATDPNAVLDSSFRVRGTAGLRVVDASVFPRIPGTFIVLPIYMVSEKATDVILSSLGETRKEANFPR